MEIKTAEQYVIARLQELEDKVQEYETRLANQAHTIERLHSVINTVKVDLVVKTSPSSPNVHYVDLDAAWESYDKDRYDWYIKTFNLKVDEEGDKDNG